MNKPVEFLAITSENPPVFPCWAYDYEWKMVYKRGHLLDQHTHWAPGGCNAPSISPSSVISDTKSQPPVSAPGTETPRTHSMVSAWRAGNLTIQQDSCVPADFARQLERELTALRRQAELDRETIRQYEAIAIQTVPGEHGEGVEQGASPEYLKATIDYLQKEWDGAETRLALADADKKRLDWLLAYITAHGLNGLKKIAWSLYDEDGKSLMEHKTVSEDDVADIQFDRAAIDRHRAASLPTATPEAKDIDTIALEAANKIREYLHTLGHTDSPCEAGVPDPVATVVREAMEKYAK